MNFYQRLKDLRIDKELKQEDIARVLETTRQQISKYECGTQMMGIDKYIKLARYYDVSIDYLCGLIDEPVKLSEQKKRKSL